MKKYISIDIGGTAIKYGIIGEDATVFSRDETPTRAEQGGPAILQRVIDLTEALLQTTTASGICISTAGMVDPVRGEIFYAAPLIPNYAGTCFKQVLETKFGLPCEVENDVNCAGLAEYRSGAAQGSRSMVMLTIGTGIANLCYVLDPEIVVLGGGIMENATIFGRVNACLRHELLPNYRMVDVRAAKLGNAAGLYGAAIQAETRAKALAAGRN